ncbi:MAG: N-acetylmuramoyl-L-alanine amidase [Lachnospiraceae bacterium]|nr:N-acetylmuramoyl-L-alanine amidase [Lachnospiraceae bacterium]
MKKRDIKRNQKILKTMLTGALLAFFVGIMFLTAGALKKDPGGITVSDPESFSSGESIPIPPSDSRESGSSVETAGGDSSLAESGKEAEKNGFIVCIDPGHEAEQIKELEPNAPGSDVMKQGVTSGAYGEASGKNEYEINLEVSLLLRDELTERGYEVVMTRETHEVRISNIERAKIAADAGADILVRIHCNGVDNKTVQGVLCYGPSLANPYLSKDIITKSQKLCVLLRDGQCASTGQLARENLYEDNMTGINWATMPVSIVEMGFMSNAEEDLYMASREGQEAIAKGLADGVDDYFKEYPKKDS